MTSNRTILLTAALFASLGASLLTTGCGSTPRGASGYLSDYSRLAQNPNAPEDSSAKLWVAPGNVLLDYDRLLIEPYSLQPKSGSFLDKIDRANARDLVDELRSEMVRTVSPYYDVVDQPGEGVLRMRVAITDLGFRTEERDPANASSVSIEAEMMDSRTGEQLAAAMRTFSVAEGESAYDALAQALLTFMNRQHGAE